MFLFPTLGFQGLSFELGLCQWLLIGCRKGDGGRERELKGNSDIFLSITNEDNSVTIQKTWKRGIGTVLLRNYDFDIEQIVLKFWLAFKEELSSKQNLEITKMVQPRNLVSEILGTSYHIKSIGEGLKDPNGADLSQESWEELPHGRAEKELPLRRVVQR